MICQIHLATSLADPNSVRAWLQASMAEVRRRSGEALPRPYLIVDAVESLEPGVYRVVESEGERHLSLQSIRLGELLRG